MSKRRIQDAVNVIQQQKRRYTVPPQQFTRRNPRAQRKVQTNGSKRILTGTKETNEALRNQVSKIEQHTNQASGLAPANNPMFQLSEMHMTTFQETEQEAPQSCDANLIHAIGPKQTVGGCEPHLSMTLNPCIKALNSHLTVPVVPPSAVFANRVTGDEVNRTFDRTAATSLNLTEFAEKNHADDLSDSGDSSLVCVKGYQVKPENVTLLTSVLAKYGDIGAKCSVGSVSVRSLFMEKLCDILKKLSSASLGVITEHELAEMRAYVSGIGGANVEVEWLQNRLDEIHEAKKAMPQLKRSSETKLLHAESKEKLKMLKAELERYKKCFAAKHAEALVIRSNICEVESEISVTETEVVEAENTISESKAKLKKVYELGSLLGGLI